MKTNGILVSEISIIISKYRITTGNCNSFNNCIRASALNSACTRTVDLLPKKDKIPDKLCTTLHKDKFS